MLLAHVGVSIEGNIFKTRFLPQITQRYLTEVIHCKKKSGACSPTGGRLYIDNFSTPADLYYHVRTSNPLDGAGAAGYFSIEPLKNNPIFPNNFFRSFTATNLKAAEFMQYLNPVGFGPSENTCPRCESPNLERTSTRGIHSLLSTRLTMWPGSNGFQKDGQPVPESYL